ncbi:hypothetical protein C8R42DRAFT_306348 [Lentinula raphanica]|nr:hypothetical protein C8R42DRAFT_306348 [Lentinula raphanica]
MFHHRTIYRTLLFLCLSSILGASASPVRRATSVKLASIPSTTATTCPFKDGASSNHSEVTSSPAKEDTAKTKDQPHEKRGRKLKLYRLECFEHLEVAVNHPAQTVIPGPTSFSYLGGLDMTPDPTTAEAWGLYELEQRNVCPPLVATHIGSTHRFVLLEYTLRDPHSELVMHYSTLDLDELQKNQAALKRLVPPGVPVPRDLVTWWHSQSDSLAQHHAPTPYNSWMDQQYNHADILAGSIPTGDWAHVIPGIGPTYRQYVLKSPRCKFSYSNKCLDVLLANFWVYTALEMIEVSMIKYLPCQ